MSTKAKRTLGCIYCQFYRFCSRSALLKLYSSLGLPILDYNSLIWDRHLLKDIRQLDSVQTFACQMATKHWSASDSGLQSICHLPSLKLVECISNFAFFTSHKTTSLMFQTTYLCTEPLVVSVFLKIFSCFVLEPTLTLSCFLLFVVL